MNVNRPGAQKPGGAPTPFFEDINRVQDQVRSAKNNVFLKNYSTYLIYLQGKELFNTVSASPFTQMGLNYGKNMWEKSKVRNLFFIQIIRII